MQIGSFLSCPQGRKAYYNEHDKFAAQWLRNLIAKGLIADGEVDERDIQQVRPDDLRGFRQCHFFAGIGGWSYALRLAGWPDDEPVWTGSCPCQPFSAAGKQKGFKDERHLWPDWFNLIRVCRPSVIFGEQVASPVALGWFDAVRADLEGADYAAAGVDFCAAGVGAPHIRQRLYWLGYASKQRSWRDSGSILGTQAESERQGCRTGNQFDQPEPSITTQRLGDPSRPRLEGWQSVHGDDGKELAPTKRASGESSGLANDDYGGLGQDIGSVPARQSNIIGGGSLSGLANNDSERCEERSQPDSNQIESGIEASRRVDAGGCEQDGGLANANGTEWREDAEGRIDDIDRPNAGREKAASGFELDCETGWTSPLDGFWRDADWIFCRDGKWRPIEPGTFPLASGVPARVGRLRGYGNSIVAPQAAEFIRACLEILP